MCPLSPGIIYYIRVHEPEGLIDAPRAVVATGKYVEHSQFESVNQMLESKYFLAYEVHDIAVLPDKNITFQVFPEEFITKEEYLLHILKGGDNYD